MSRRRHAPADAPPGAALALQQDPTLALARWQVDPVQWCMDWLGDAHVPALALPDGRPLGRGPFWWRQVEILEALVDYREVNVVTGHAIGKDHLAGRAVAWWECTRPDAIAVTTSAKEQQVVSILWGELRNALKHARVPLGGDLAPVAPEWRFGPKHYALGMVARDTNAAQGFHGDHVLVVISEAAGVPGDIQQALESCAAGSTCRILRIGNPTCGPDHPFAKACALPDVPGLRKTIRIPSTDSPNYALGREVIPGLATREYVQSMRDKYGESSMVYRARVLALFPTAGADGLIPADFVDAARARLARAPVRDLSETPVRMGVDVARFGDDLTCVWAVRGPRVVTGPLTIGKADGNVLAERILLLAKTHQASSVAIDGGGLGAGLLDALDKLLQAPANRGLGLEVIPCDFGSKATDPHEWSDKRTELYWRLREWLRDEAEADLEDMTVEEIVAHRYGFSVGTAKRLESKASVKGRLGRSPDRADGLALAIGGHLGRYQGRPRVSFW